VDDFSGRNPDFRAVKMSCWPRWAAFVFPLLVCAGLSHAQITNPTPQSLPYVQNFGTAAFSSLPAGIAAWNGLNGGSISTSALAASSTPSGDATVVSRTAVTTTGGSSGLAIGGDARFYIQVSGASPDGANQLACAINTTGWNNIVLSYDVRMEVTQTRTIGVVCQYRVGESGAWSTLTPTTGANPFSQSGGSTGVQTSPQITLPASAENQPKVQIRWAIWRGTESGASAGLSIDNLSISGAQVTATLSAGLSSTSISESAGANATTLTVTRTGDTSTALPVTLAINDATEAAYDGPNPLTIPAGQTSVAFPIRAVDDDGNDGTQTVTLTVSAPGTTGASTTLSVLDDEDPYSPPIGYYANASGLTGAPLKAALKVIASPANYHQYAYSDTYGPLRGIYEDPDNAANVLLVYSGTSIGKNVSYYPGGPSPDASWSREHAWPGSFGLDPGNVDPGSTDGDAGPDYTDLFNLRPCLQTVNNSRSNRYYDETSGTVTVPPLAPGCSYTTNVWEPRDVEKGDLARAMFYMATRYDGTGANTMDLEIANTANASIGQFANLSTLLRWNDEDPVSPEERRRNQKTYTDYQHNRNPFIDHPEYIAQIWGTFRQSKLAATVTEGGAGDSYTLVLASQPTADVTITFATSPNNQVAVSPASLTFTSSNWNQAQTVTLSAVNDTVYESAPITATVQHIVTSSDARYSAIKPTAMTVTVNDDDPQIAPTSLPVAYGGPWDTLPSGFLSTGTNTYTTSLGTDMGTGSAKFDDANDQLTIAFSSAPSTLSYILKGNPSTTGTFLVQQSVDGTTFSTVRTVTNKTSAEQTFSDTLNLTTRYVKFLYSAKTTGNIQLDQLAITAAPAFQNWASTYGLDGSSAAMLFDADFDGSVNLLEYGLGRSPVLADAGATAPVLERLAGKLRITAIVRNTDAALTLAAQTTTTISNAQSWTTTGVTQVSSVDQTGVPAGFLRVAFEVSDSGATVRFLRLVFGLN